MLVSRFSIAGERTGFRLAFTDKCHGNEVGLRGVSCVARFWFFNVFHVFLCFSGVVWCFLDCFLFCRPRVVFNAVVVLEIL